MPSNTAAALDPTELEVQHTEFRRRASELVEAIRGKKGDLARHVTVLQEYAVGHFGAEEEHMRARGYPGYLRHQAEHDRFLEDLLALTAEFERDGARAFEALGAERWLRTWLDRHVGGTDEEFTGWMRKQGA